MTGEEGSRSGAGKVDQTRTKLNPGDQAAPGAPGSGENVCPECRGSGRLDNRSCPVCGGTGKVQEGLAGG